MAAPGELPYRRLLVVGAGDPDAIDREVVRLLAATNRDIIQAIRDNQFREDLYHRLNVVAIAPPPLRERKEDIPVLADFFLRKSVSSTHRKVTGISAEAMAKMINYNWPGNVRELANAIERAVALETGTELKIDLDPSRLRPPASGAPSNGNPKVTPDGLDFEKFVADIERSLIEQALRRTGGNKSQAADILGMKRTTLTAKMRALEAAV